MQLSELFWSATVAELSQGYVFSADSDAFVCLICGEHFTKGVIYEHDGTLYESEKFVGVHIAKNHGPVLHFLLDLDKRVTGLTDHQNRVIRLFASGLEDSQIAKELGTTSTSTIRNHRFSLKEKEKQARVFLAIMDNLRREPFSKEEPFISIHRTATMIDERYAITEKENEEILRKYFLEGLDGPLSKFPNKEKRKLVVLRHIVKRFDFERRYSEKEVNEILKQIYQDFVTIRRYLIEYGFMDRERDGSQYWLKK